MARLTAGAAVLLLALVAGSSRAAPDTTGAVALPGFHELPVAILPCGSGLGPIPGSDCRDRDHACQLLLLRGPADEVHVFDQPANLLKRVWLEGASPSLTAVAGPDLRAGDRSPHDGCVGPDGTVYLLADAESPGEQIVVHARSPLASAWVRAEALNDSSVGWVTVRGRRIRGHQITRIAVEPDGRVTVFHWDRRPVEAIVVADSGRLLEAAERRRLVPDPSVAGDGIATGNPWTLLLGYWDERDRPSDVHGCGITVWGEWPEADTAGNTYRVDYASGEGAMLRRFDRHGRLTASSPYPRRPADLGCAGALAAAAAGPYEFRLEGCHLVITRWVVEE